MQTIEKTLLTYVIGGATASAMQFDPGLVATINQAGRRKGPPKESPEMMQAVRSMGETLSGVATAQRQAQQQSSAQMMQMLPQLLGR